MELRYRVLPPASEPDPGPGVDLSLDLGPGATIGDIARAAANAMPHAARSDGRRDHLTLEVTGRRPLDPDLAAHLGAPPSGSVVRLVPADRTAPAPPLRSTVSLTATDGRRHTLLHGTNAIGWCDGADIPLPRSPGVPERALIDVAERVTVRSTGSIGRLEVDGDIVLGAAVVEHGSLIRLGDHVFAVRIDGPLPVPNTGPFTLDDGDRLAWPAPRHVADDGPPVEFPAPPSPARPPGLPVLSASVPLLMGLAVWAATRNAAIVAFVLFSVVFVVASALESRRESRREARFRRDEFHTAVLDGAARLHERARAVRARGRRAHPSPTELCRRRHDRHPRLWERSPDRPQDLTVRVGTHSGAADVPVRIPTAAPTALRNRVDTVVRAARAGESVATVDLAAVRTLAVVGHGPAAAALARGVVAQIAHGVGPDRLRIAVLAGPGAAPQWGWIDWLPHHIRADQLQGEPALLVVDGADETCRDLALERIRDRADDLVLWTAVDRVGVPASVGAVLELTPGHPDGTAELRTADDPPLMIVADHVDLADVDAAARWMCGRRPTGQQAADAPLPTLRDVLERPDSIDDADVLIGVWRDAPPQPSAPIGLSGGGVVVVDLQRDGPHAVVAGTTGAGKSELLRTLLTSLALHHPPSRVNLLLIDYKGGTAFGDLDDLPHSVGLVTDLDGGLADRVVQSLLAELRRREHLERSGAPPEPALVVAVDEFATLIREVPGFIEGVVDVAQRGRSLGIHLVLATQRPAGVITDAIRANTSLRICLRVADDDDSRDVLGVSDAAHLDRDRPGRALVRTARPGLTDLQIAWSGAPSRRERASVRARPLHRTSTTSTTTSDHGANEPAVSSPPPTSELAIAVQTATAAAERLGGSAPRRPWCAPLPARVSIDRVGDALVGHAAADTTALSSELSSKLSSEPSSSVTIGLVDRPDAQRVDPLEIDLLGRGGVLVIGAGGSGRSTVLHTLAGEFARRAGSRVHVIDPTGSLSALRDVGTDVVELADVERTLRLLRSLLDRPASLDGPDTLLVIDGWAAVCEHHERFNRGEAVELLARIATGARGSGVRLAVSATTPIEVPTPVAASVGHRLVLRCSSTDDACSSGVPIHLADPRTPPGRGWLDGHLVQVATPRTGGGTIRCSYATPSLPPSIPLDELDVGDPWRWPLGRRAGDLGPASIDLTAGHLLVLGPPRSGRSTVLQACAVQARRSGPDTVVASVDGRDPDRARAAATVRAVLELADAGSRGGVPDVLLVIDDICELLEDDVELDQRLAAVLRRPGRIRVAASAELDGVARSFADSPRLLRIARRGVLLQPDPDLHPPLLHTSVPRRDDLPPGPGRGWIVGDGPPVAVQFAVP